jgi:hypothetical protein
MTKIEVGGDYKVHRFRKGENEKGDWELIVVKAEGRGGREITIFPKHIPTGAREGGKIRIESIDSVAVKIKKDEAGNWTRQETAVEADVSALIDADPFDGDDPFKDTGDLL